MTVSLYYHTIFIIVVLYCLFGNVRKKSVNLFAIPLTLLVTFLIAFFPVPWNTGGDRELYALAIEYNRMFGIGALSQDKLFGIYNNLMAGIVNYQGWFIITALIYSFNHYLFARKVVPNYTFLLLLMFFSSLMFYGYGTNTIRAGFAASFILLAIANYNSIWKMGLYMLLGVGCHMSMAIPSIALIITRFLDKPRLYYALWFISIILSAVMGSYFEVLFASIGGGSRVSYLAVSASETTYKVGFRIDFILYSCIPVLAGYYYIVKKQFKDRFYSILYNTYLLANCFWILVIRANYSDRFAYLSWFIYPVVLIYPLLKEHLVINQSKKIVLIVFLHTLFTYIMFLR